MFRLQDYYAEQAVRQRMVEFLGGSCLDQATCAYLTADCSSPQIDYRPRAPAELWSCLEQGLEVKRSLWDYQSLVVHLDIEYVNFDYPAEPYLDRERCLDFQRPVVRRLQKLLLNWGIAPLHLLSGRGHHLTWRVRRDSAAFQRLVELGILTDTLHGIYRHPQPPREEPVGLQAGAAFAGVGQILEFLAHQLLRDPSLRCPIRVQLTEVETAGQFNGREIVCVDLSEYGDPLHTRMVRIPFSVYHKPEQHRAALGDHVVDRLPQLFLLPLFEMDEHLGSLLMRDPLQAAELARYASVEIPDQSDGTTRLAQAYEASPTAAFHRWYYSQEHELPERWPETYDRTPLKPLPPCARHMLIQPNDVLLKPAGIRHLVRVLMALGWHPRHVAGLIRSKYERDFGWGPKFFHYDAATRADFYTRLFAGLIAVGLDNLDDFCCDSLRAVHFCPTGQCNESLARFHQSLNERQHHERLASRPIHGLFLPEEHL